MHSCLGQLAVSFERCARSTCHSNLQTHMRQHEGQVLTMIRNAVWAGSSQLTGIKAQFPLERPERHKGMCEPNSADTGIRCEQLLLHRQQALPDKLWARLEASPPCLLPWAPHRTAPLTLLCFGWFSNRIKKGCAHGDQIQSRDAPAACAFAMGSL